jgi:hypothetical protein
VLRIVSAWAVELGPQPLDLFRSGLGVLRSGRQLDVQLVALHPQRFILFLEGDHLLVFLRTAHQQQHAAQAGNDSEKSALDHRGAPP